jgi:hypothetical protein
LTFSNIDVDGYNYNNDCEFSNNIIILKRVRSLKQLRITEKELVRLNYKEAIIKGFTMKGIQQYIASKTKIWIKWSCLVYLKKAEEKENREWYNYMAKDHFAYIGVYRKCIDEIEQLKKELWTMVMDSKTLEETRIHALKELHALSKTCTLLIKDLPFITSLSEYYGQNTSLLESNYNDNPIQSKEKRYSNKHHQDIDTDPTLRKELDRPGNSDDLLDSKKIKDFKIVVNRIDSNNKSHSINNNPPKQIDDEIMKDMQSQLHLPDNLKGKNLEEITDEDIENSFTPQHKESVRKLRELLDI